MAELRVCIVYDCLFPWTVGGAERWYRALATSLAENGCQVTYVTRRQWSDSEAPEIPGVRVVPVSAGSELYDAEGHRRLLPPLMFGWGVLRHMARHRSAYDVVHTCGFPYFPLLSIRLSLMGKRRRPLIVGEWVEVWTREYWSGYAGRLVGRIGLLVQMLCIRLTPNAVSHSRLHASRLRLQGYRGPEPFVITGLYAGGPPATRLGEREPVALFAGRHIDDKQPEVLPEAIKRARQDVPDLRGLILGDGPRRAAVLRAIDAAGASSYIDAPGFVTSEALHEAMRSAAVHVLPSRREGHGIVLVEAAATGTPSVVVEGPDNAATELITDGVNGVVVPDARPESIAMGITTVMTAGRELRVRTAQWFDANQSALNVATSCERVLALYRDRLGRPR